jgi:hypothetical protein
MNFLKTFISDEGKRTKFLHFLLFLEFIATLTVASIGKSRGDLTLGWSDNIIISANIEEMRTGELVLLQATSEIRWINEKLNELSARHVRVSNLTTEQTMEVGELSGVFSYDYSIFKYLFEVFNENLETELLTPTQESAYLDFVELTVRKM